MTTKPPSTKKAQEEARVFRGGRRRVRRNGAVKPAEQALVTQFVKDQPHEITPRQVNQLSQLMGRSESVVKSMIEKARDKFRESAEIYVDTHLQATAGALLKGDYEIAARASQWAMENLSAEGARIIEKDKAGPSQPKVMVGINLGGVPMPTPPTVTVVDPNAPVRG